MQLVSRSQQSHWYRALEDGSIEACYEVPYADGRGMRSTTLADARKQNLLIGISSVVNVMPKPALVNWRIIQAVLASLTLPRKEGEALDDYAHRVIEDSEAQSEQACDFGTQIHQGIEDYLNEMEIRTPGFIKEYLESFYDWATENIETIYDTEQIVGDPALGIAGKLDANVDLKGVGPTVLDFKTQAIRKGPVFYPEWPLQLSAYRHCAEREMPGTQLQICSVIVNSSQPGPVHVNLWLGGRQQYWQLFQHCLEIWKYVNGYDPAQL